MKKIILIVAITAGLCSCNSGGSGSSSNSKPTDPTANTPGVVNANGNMPDTSNSITIEKHSKDTAIKH